MNADNPDSVLPLVQRAWARLSYRLWLFFGGRRTEDGFRYLSEEILRLTKQRNELRRQVRDLDRRVWQLEGHTLEETFQRASKALIDIENKSQDCEVR